MGGGVKNKYMLSTNASSGDYRRKLSKLETDYARTQNGIYDLRREFDIVRN